MGLDGRACDLSALRAPTCGRLWQVAAAPSTQLPHVASNDQGCASKAYDACGAGLRHATRHHVLLPLAAATRGAVCESACTCAEETAAEHKGERVCSAILAASDLPGGGARGVLARDTCMNVTLGCIATLNNEPVMT